MSRFVKLDRRVLACFALLAISAGGCQRPKDLGPTADNSAAERIRTALLAGSESGDGAAAESTGTGWGTLKGRLTYAGDPPQLPPYPVSKDEASCAPGGKAPSQQYLLVDADTKGIANVVLFARKASRVHDSAQPRTEPVLFDQKNCVFLTHVIGVTVGQQLDIKNSDTVGHNTNIVGQNSFNQSIPSGPPTACPIKKEEAAPAPVRCSIHPWMIAYLLPRKNAYFAITAADGTFEIPNLPAGEEVEIQVWHEHAANATGALVVDSPEAKKLDWSNKGRITVKLEPDETREVEVAVPPAAFKS